MIDDASSKPAGEKFDAAKYSYGKVVYITNFHISISFNCMINFLKKSRLHKMFIFSTFGCLLQD